MYYYSPFRSKYQKESKGDDCVFCNKARMHQQAVVTSEGLSVENKYYRWVVNWYPKFEGHTMLIPKMHHEEIGQELPQEIIAREELIAFAVCAIKKLYPDAGIEFFVQTGSGSARSRRHIHWHLVPAKPDDPLRSFEKLGHFYTTKKDEEKLVIFPIKIKLAKEGLQQALAPIVSELYKQNGGFKCV